MPASTTTLHPFTAADWAALRKCERALHKWAEDECEGRIQYDGDGSARRYFNDRYGSHTIPGPVVPDKSESAMMAARKIAAKHGLSVYNQTDPRGCALYVYSAADLKGRNIDECYSTVARAVV